MFGIGYEITATAAGYKRIYKGWYEGSSRFKRKVEATVAKKVMTMAMKTMVNGSVVRVIDIVSKPIQLLGAASGQFIAHKLREINILSAGLGLEIFDIDVTVTGYFVARYKIVDKNDLKALPELLSMIPEEKDQNKFMGESVLEAAYMAQVNYARHLYQFASWEFDELRRLRVNIDL